MAPSAEGPLFLAWSPMVDVGINAISSQPVHDDAGLRRYVPPWPSYGATSASVSGSIPARLWARSVPRPYRRASSAAPV